MLEKQKSYLFFKKISNISSLSASSCQLFYAWQRQVKFEACLKVILHFSNWIQVQAIPLKNYSDLFVLFMVGVVWDG